MNNTVKKTVIKFKDFIYSGLDKKRSEERQTAILAGRQRYNEININNTQRGLQYTDMSLM